MLHWTFQIIQNRWRRVPNESHFKGYNRCHNSLYCIFFLNSHRAMLQCFYEIVRFLNFILQSCCLSNCIRLLIYTHMPQHRTQSVSMECWAGCSDGWNTALGGRQELAGDNCELLHNQAFNAQVFFSIVDLKRRTLKKRRETVIN